MEIQEVKSEFFQNNESKALFDTNTIEDKSLKDLNNSFSKIKLKSLKSGSILPSLQLYTTNIKTVKKKKNSKIENKYANSLYENRNDSQESNSSSIYKDDWSKQSCDEFFVPVESFLDTQLKREKSSKRRCKQVEKLRNIENNRKYVEERLNEYDEKISLNVLLKHSKSCSLQVSNPMSSIGTLNYRALMAEEIIRKNSLCNRCSNRNRKYEDNFFLKSINFGLSKNKKKTNLAFPTIAPKAFTSQSFYHSSNYQQMLHHQQQNSQFNEISYRNLSDLSNENILKSLNSTNNLISFDSNSLNMYRKPFMNKAPIEVQKKHVF